MQALITWSPTLQDLTRGLKKVSFNTFNNTVINSQESLSKSEKRTVIKTFEDKKETMDSVEGYWV